MLCEWCQSLVLPDQVQSHLKNSNHKQSRFKVDKAHLEAALAEMEIEPELPLPPCTYPGQEAPPPFRGLAVLKGFECPNCPQLSISEKYLQRHHVKKHPDHSQPSHFSECFMQRFNLSSNRDLFKVEPHPSVQLKGIAAIIASAREEMAKVLDAPRVRKEVDPRAVSPWLLTTKWHEHVRGFEVQELCNLIAFPRKTEFPGLQKAVEDYFLEATNEIPSLQELTLQILNTDDPVKT